MNQPRRGFIFTHGISSGPSARAQMRDRIVGYLTEYKVKDLFCRDQNEYIEVAKWRSLGDFVGDLEDLYRHEVRREEAVQDCAAQTHALMERLLVEADRENDSVSPELVICGHSMGQIMSIRTVIFLEKTLGKLPMPCSLLTMGGPAGNLNIAGKQYLNWFFEEYKGKPVGLTDHVDVWNLDDPVCCDPLLPVGYKTPPGAKSFELKFKEKQNLKGLLTLKEHSSYFEDPFCFNILADLVKELDMVK